MSPEDYNKILYCVYYYMSKSKRYSTEFIPDGIFYSIIDSCFNSVEFANQFDNKSYYPLIFHDVHQPETIALRLGNNWLTHEYSRLSFSDVVDFCMERDEVVIKHSRSSCGGSGVSFYSGYTKTEIEGLLKASSVDIIIQEPIAQHIELAKLHSYSVNTIRIITLLFRDTVSVLSSVLRMGVGNTRKDNVSLGGIVCGISKHGKLKDTAFDKLGNRYDSHPEGMRFSEIQIPKYDELEQLAVSLQYRFPYCKMISWDFAVDINGDPVLIEANLSRGELDFHQLCNGPLFGNMALDIVADVIREYL